MVVQGAGYRSLQGNPREFSAGIESGQEVWKAVSRLLTGSRFCPSMSVFIIHTKNFWSATKDSSKL
jgi:hypothetical protein